jgi:hypothetical protein
MLNNQRVHRFFPLSNRSTGCFSQRGSSFAALLGAKASVKPVLAKKRHSDLNQVWHRQWHNQFEIGDGN